MQEYIARNLLCIDQPMGLTDKDPVPVNLQSHVIYQFECAGCKAKHIGKTDRCLELGLNEHSNFRTSAVGKHLYECEHFHHFCLFRFGIFFH